MKKEGNGAEFFDYLSLSQQPNTEDFLTNKNPHPQQQEVATREGEDIPYNGDPSRNNVGWKPQAMSYHLGSLPPKEEPQRTEQQQQQQPPLVMNEKNQGNSRNSYIQPSSMNTTSKNTPTMSYSNKQYLQNENTSNQQHFQESISNCSFNKASNQKHIDSKENQAIESNQVCGTTLTPRDDEDPDKKITSPAEKVKQRNGTPSDSYYKESINDQGYPYSRRYPSRHQLRQGYIQKDPHLRPYSPMVHHPPLLPLMSHHFAPPAVVDSLVGSVSPREVHAILDENYLLKYELDSLGQQFQMEKLGFQRHIRYLTARIRYLEEKKEGIFEAEDDRKSYRISSQQQQDPDSSRNDEARVTTDSHDDLLSRDYSYRIKGKSRNDDSSVKNKRVETMTAA
ncbi:hypothetical protein BDF20DRAFT_615492 [Mycotypha africana]|uniref:uncharacterized protein n=1 Tax=Mycotypha africana TaxID=64632 RepID=UPI0023018263|nr:uncharacterized protein BDF20DRAFT_615492 [Mycotypha africana]KAI8975576.1 hypothetical protein BDF20DRAFT_615492 [Mycotypha africana]